MDLGVILNCESHAYTRLKLDHTEDIVADDISATTEDVCSSGTEEDMPSTPDTPDFEAVTIGSTPSDRPRSRCTFDTGCDLLSPDRKVTSHYFGRNKKETRAIPEDCWVLYCRQHYQRVRYRSTSSDFAQIQMNLVRSTVVNLQEWGGVKNFNLSLRKRAMDKIEEEDRYAAAVRQAKELGGTDPPSPPSADKCKERWLLQYTGPNVGFNEVYDFIDMVIAYCRHQDCDALEFEIVPNFHENISRNRSATRCTKKRKSTGANRVVKSSQAGSSTASQVRAKMLASRPKKS